MVEVNMKEIRDKFAEDDPGAYDLIANAVEEENGMELLYTVIYEIALQEAHKANEETEEVKAINGIKSVSLNEENETVTIETKNNLTLEMHRSVAGELFIMIDKEMKI